MTSIAVLSSVNNFVMLLFVLFSSAPTCLYVVLYNVVLITIEY